MASKVHVLCLAFAVACFPYTLGRLCDFQSGMCDWTQSGSDNYNWFRKYGQTSTSNTGPTYDKTYGSTGYGYYLYIEASNMSPNNVAVLLSPVFPHKNNRQIVCVRFWYNMYGYYMGILRVKRLLTSRNIGTGITLGSWSGQQTSPTNWLEANLCTSDPTSNFRIAFEATRGYSDTSDMAIDDVEIFVLPTEITLSDPTGLLPSTDAISYLVHGVDSQFTCQLPDIDPGASFTWTLGGRELTFASSTNGAGSGGLITSNSSLILTPTWSNHSELLHCQARNKQNHPGLSISATLDIKVPPTVITMYESTDNITQTNGTSFVIKGVESEFICEVPGTRPAVSIEWSLGSWNITANESTDVVGADGLTTSRSTVRLSTTWNHHGELLQCSASNIDNWPAVNASVTLDVTVCPRIHITTCPLTATTGSNSSFRCVSESSNPEPDLMWFRDEEEQVNPAQPEITDGDYGGRVTTLNFTTGVLTEEDDGALYTCCARGNAFCPRVCDACLMNVAFHLSDVKSDPGLSAGRAIAIILSVAIIVVIVAGVMRHRRSTTKRSQGCQPAEHTGPESGKSDEGRYAAVEAGKNTGVRMQVMPPAERK
ncbi:uncharacterized protein LOC119735129 [Patiria miniata]|uniref:Uncharacterized protein n=1 Tax=Patiria miniata TaxID=46514 RepID=A0A914ALY7_PATMI|nr:uncharacterized protein LOC119735129 [Patiria miniata]